MNIIDKGVNNRILLENGTHHEHGHLNIDGNHNEIIIRQGTTIGAKIFIQGDNNRLVVSNHCKINGNIHIRQGSCVMIGSQTTFVFVNIFALESTPIIIGKDCMFSSGIVIRNSDEHSIIDQLSGKRINPASPVIIKDRVWLSENVYVLKGVTIHHDIIVGANSLVVDNLTESHAIFAGSPTKRIRSHVSWDRKLIKLVV